jgi:predicted alpha/beta superfamily hydrolase
MLTMLRATAIAWTLLVFPGIVFSQAQPNATFAPVVKGLVLQDVECSEFHSRFTGHDYHVYVSLPASYRQGDQRYPVLYVPDFEDGFLIFKIATDMMSLGNMLEDFILVGVPIKSEGVQDFIRKRAFVFTPTEVESQNKSLGARFGGEVHTGGAPLFLRTLKEELIPYIESKYRITSDRGLAGYSFSALFAAYVWLNDGSTFSRYLIGSPSLWWDKGMLLKTEADLAKSGKTLHGRVFISVGADEDENMVGTYKNLTAAITSHAYPDLRLESHIFESTDHLSGPPGAASRGLKFLYALPQPKQ